MLVEYLRLASARLYISGQPGRKSKRGRPGGGISLIARQVPAIGRTGEARRKIISRFTKIAEISPEAKEAARKARLDNNQGALLKIAKAGGRKAQLRKVAELAQRSQKLKPGFGSTQARKAPPLQPSAPVAAHSATAKKTAATSPGRETTLDEMEAFWNREGRKLWAYLPFRDRERFIEMLRRARCRAQVDVVAFLRDVFRGRHEVAKHDLYALCSDARFGKGLCSERNQIAGLSCETEGLWIGCGLVFSQYQS